MEGDPARGGLSWSPERAGLPRGAQLQPVYVRARPRPRLAAVAPVQTDRGKAQAAADEWPSPNRAHGLVGRCHSKQRRLFELRHTGRDLQLRGS